MKRRLLALGVVVLGLLPTVWLRDPPPSDNLRDYDVREMAFAQPDGWPNGFSLEGAWQLTASNPRFGGFSALHLSSGTFSAWTDRGDHVRFATPGGDTNVAHFAPLPPERAFIYAQDIESVVVDEDTGFTWFGYENPNALRRVSATGQSLAVRIPAMTAWGDNAGAEAMVRLPDGRFLALAENRETAVMFADYPFFAPKPTMLRIDRPSGWRPTDMAMLPDGRALVLLRRVERRWPPFRTMLAVGEPALLDPERPWRLEPVLELAMPELAENYEGLVVKPIGKDAVTIWLISDDNLSALQRNLLLELRWDMAAQKQKAREDQPSAPLQD